MRLFIAFSLVSSLLAASEPSVFGAGNLNIPEPYGLSAEEKLILENKKEIQAVAQKNNIQTAKVDTVTERLDGLQGIVEGLNLTVNDQKIALQKMAESRDSEGNLSATIDALRQQNSTNSEHIAQLKALLEELSHVVDGINASYVSKEEFSLLLKQLKIALPSQGEPTVKTDIQTLEKRAKELFEQQKYGEAQTYFEMMIQKKQKIAEANFWIGETYFQRKGYREAISYYKESASKNDKAAYMPTLLLHTGVSMEKNGDAASARAFYKATITKYKGSGAATEAEAKLSKLK